MKREALAVAGLILVVAVAVAGILLWRGRPWRMLVSVNGRALTAEEADRFSDGLLGVTVRETMDDGDRLRRVAGAWTVKEVLLQDAVARGLKVSSEEMEVSRAAAKSARLGFGFEECVLVSSLVLHDAVEPAFAERAFTPTNAPDATALFRARATTRLRACFERAFARVVVKSPVDSDLERAGGAFGLPPEDAGFLWLLWDLRPVIGVNGRTLTAREFGWRARTLLDDAKRTEHLVVPADREEEVLRFYSRRAAQLWILKEVLLAEAVARKFQATPADEKAELVRTAARLKSRNLTPEAYFKEGPIPEAIKRRDFREAILIRHLTDREVEDRISVTTPEIEARFAELRKTALATTKPGERPKVKPSRKTAIDMLRAERYQRGFRRLFRDLYGKFDVRCPEYPVFETVDGVSPPRPEDAEPEAKTK